MTLLHRHDFQARWTPRPTASVQDDAPGFPALTVGGGGTEAVAFSTLSFARTQPRLRFRATSGSPNSALSIYHPDSTKYLVALPNQSIGFVWRCRFSLRDDLNSTFDRLDTAMFIGIGGPPGPMGNVGIPNIRNAIGMCWRAGQHSPEMLCAGPNSQTRKSLDYIPAISVQANGEHCFDLTIATQPYRNGGHAMIWWRVALFLTDGVPDRMSGVFAEPADELPLGTTMVDFNAFRSYVGAATNRVGFHLHTVDVHCFTKQTF